MEIQQHRIKVPRTAHYYSLGVINQQTKRIWVVIHGYGQLAKYFIRKFEPLISTEDAVVAPEGISKYYLKSGSKRVGASWMTKENREDEIEDQIAYLDRMLKEILSNTDNVEVVLLGFSQGVSTAFRWYSMGEIQPYRVVFWSGRIPNERIVKEGMKIPALQVYGQNDEYLHLWDEEEQREILKRNFSEYQIKVFDGVHEITPKLVEQML